VLSAPPATQNWSSRLVNDVTVMDQGFSLSGRDSSRFATSISTRGLGMTKHWDVSLGIARIPGSPWMSFSGMFGTINSSVMMDLSGSWKSSGGTFVQGGVMQTTTNFTPGLIRDITPLWSAYAVAGWQDQNWSIYGGLQPTLFSGKISMDLPSSVDRHGNIQYNNHTVSIRNQPVKFVGTQYQWKQKHHRFVWGAAINDTGSYRMQFNYQMELK
jgi:hypothetical protein